MELATTCLIKQRIYFGYRHKDYMELVGFGSNAYTGNFHTFCMQNLHVFRNFISYFREEAKDIIKAAQKEALNTPPSSTYHLSSNTHQDFNGYDFFNKRKISLRLTNQESACVQQLLQGKSFKETAKFLTLSPRTVESYIKNIKNKTGYESTSELLDFLFRLINF